MREVKEEKINDKTCIHLGHLINQHIFWCDLDNPAFPAHCDSCKYYECSKSTMTTITNFQSEVIDTYGKNGF